MKLHKAAKLTSIEVPAETVSTESLSNDTPPQAPAQPGQKPPPPFQFCITSQEGGKGRQFYFYLNEPAYFSEVMQITNLLSNATSADCMYLNIGSVVSQNAARLLLSILQTCPAKKIADAPFLSNIYAASILTACDEIRISPYMNAIFDYPQITAGGGIGDAEEALKFNKAEFEATLQLLISNEIMTVEDAENLKKQNLCVISSEELIKRYRAFNLRKLQK